MRLNSIFPPVSLFELTLFLDASHCSLSCWATWIGSQVYNSSAVIRRKLVLRIGIGITVQYAVAIGLYLVCVFNLFWATKHLYGLIKTSGTPNETYNLICENTLNYLFTGFLYSRLFEGTACCVWDRSPPRFGTPFVNVQQVATREQGTKERVAGGHSLYSARAHATSRVINGTSRYIKRVYARTILVLTSNQHCISPTIKTHTAYVCEIPNGNLLKI